MQKYFFYWLKDDGYQQKICQIYLKHLNNIFGINSLLKKINLVFFQFEQFSTYLYRDHCLHEVYTD